MTDWYGPVNLAPFTFSENLVICLLVALGLLGIFAAVSFIMWIFRDEINDIVGD